MHLKIMAASGIPALVTCSLIFACLCLTKQFSPYVGALDVDEDECIVDIGDMADYDPVTQTSERCEKWKKERQRARTECQAKLADTQHRLEACLTTSSHKPCDCPPHVECLEDVKPTPCHDAEDMFFRRLVRHFVNIIQEKAPESGPVEAQIEVHLTSHEWKKLKNFADGKDDYRRADIHDVMVGMTLNIFYFNGTSLIEWLGEQINLRSPAVILLTISVVVSSFVFGVGMFSDLYWNRRFIACLLSSLFVISLIWNWIYLYQEETIKRYRNAQKYEEIPASCMPHKMTWVQGLKEWFGSMTSVQTDQCFEYHRIYQVDPLFDIPPTRALSFTVSTMFVDPFKYIGRAVSEFHAEIFRDLPFWAALPALMSCYVFGFLALYAYISAPRRVLRERPGHEVRRERPRLEAVQEQNLPIAPHQEDDIPYPEDDHREGDRIENIPPPTLPAARQEKKDPPKQQGSPTKKSPRGNRKPPQGAVGGMTDGHRGVKEPLERDQEPGPSDLGPAVRPKTRPPGPTSQHLTDGNDGDTSSSDSIETVQSRPRPTHLGDNKPSKQRTMLNRTTSIGDSTSGGPVSHPASEKSDGESLIGSFSSSMHLEPTASVTLPEDTFLGYQASATDEDTTAPSSLTAGYTTPSSLGSPDDISIISQSPVNTNSASYDFITTSSFGVHGEQPEGTVPEAIGAEQGEEDYEDDFVVLKTEK